MLATQCFAANAKTQLFRMEGAGMDVVATRDHRMLLARLDSGALNTGQPFGYETVGELLDNVTSLAEGKSTTTQFEYSSNRAVFRSGLNLQPAVKLVIAGMELVCEWWWTKDCQMGFLRFLGFWLSDGHLDVNSHSVGISQRKAVSTAWLMALVDEVFPHWCYRTPNNTDANDTTYNFHHPLPATVRLASSDGRWSIGIQPARLVSPAQLPPLRLRCEAVGKGGDIFLSSARYNTAWEMDGGCDVGGSDGQRRRSRALLVVWQRRVGGGQ